MADILAKPVVCITMRLICLAVFLTSVSQHFWESTSGWGRWKASDYCVQAELSLSSIQKLLGRLDNSRHADIEDAAWHATRKR